LAEHEEEDPRVAGTRPRCPRANEAPDSQVPAFSFIALFAPWREIILPTPAVGKILSHESMKFIFPLFSVAYKNQFAGFSTRHEKL
jgi:hypothetical protein